MVKDFTRYVIQAPSLQKARETYGDTVYWEVVYD